MKIGESSLVVGGSVLVLLGAWRTRSVGPLAPRSTGASVASARTAGPRAVESYGKLPLSFEVNRGQADAHVQFLARGQGYTLFLTSQEAVLSLHKSEVSGGKGRKLEDPGWKLVADRYAPVSDRSPITTEPAKRSDAPRVTNTMLQMKLVGANAKASVTGEDELPGKSNYFIGNDAKKWRTNIATYAKVRVEDVYPGIDLVYYGNQGQLEYDFVVRPGADPSVIRLNLGSSPAEKGAMGSNHGALTHIEGNGDLLVGVEGGEVRYHKPVIYQPATTDKRQGRTEKTLIAGGYTIDGQKEAAFTIGDYDRTRPLVIDPALVYSTYLGGTHDDSASGIAVGSAGNAYVTGSADSTDFPVTANAFQQSGQYSAFVTKFSVDGSALVYSTYLGGSSTGAYAIAVDDSGDAYVTGYATSTNFPTTANAFQGTYAGGSGDAFVTELSPDGSALVYSTFLGGSGSDEGDAIALDSSGNAYVTGETSSLDFPTLNAFQSTNNSRYYYCTCTPFVAKLSPGGSTLVYSTYLGGTNYDAPHGIAVDSAGSAYVTGASESTDFPTVNPFQATNHAYGGSVNSFVAKLDPSGSSLVYSTFLGGSPGNGIGDVARGIAVDNAGSAYVTGWTGSTDFPTANPLQATNHGNTNAFITKFRADGAALVYSTYLGGSTNDSGYGITVDSSGHAYVTGDAGSSDFPTVNPTQATNHGCGDAFIAELNGAGSALVYSTYLGGSTSNASGVCGEDHGRGIALDGSGNINVTGYTASGDFPATPNAYQNQNRSTGGVPSFRYDAFVTKISPGAADVDIANNAPSVVLSGSTLTYSITVTNNGPDAASNVNIQDAIPAGTNFNSVATTSGSCTAPAPGGAGTVNCTAPGLASGSAITETLTVNVTARLLSTITDTATVSSTTFDPTSNTSATATTTVVGAPSSGGLTGSIMFGNGGRYIP